MQLCFPNLEDEYFRERATDLKDIGRRWLLNVMGKGIVDLSQLAENTIIIAKDLTPSDTAQIDLKNVLAFVTEVGGKTSHSSIMAESLELPAVVGCGTILKEIKLDSKIIVDALNGDIIVNPNQEDLDKYTKLQNDYNTEKEELKALKDKKAVSLDGVETDVYGNIGSPNDIDGVIANGGEGIGLYRTEFLFMDKDVFPTEKTDNLKHIKLLLKK